VQPGFAGFEACVARPDLPGEHDLLAFARVDGAAEIGLLADRDDVAEKADWAQ
jgi:hypothetical protein